MKATGIVRRMDELGRIVIPKEIRRSMRLEEGEALEIFTEEDAVIFKKYEVNNEEEEREEKEMEKNIVKIFDTYEDKVQYVKLSKEAADFLHWMWDEGMLNDNLDFEIVDEVEVKEF